MELDWHPQIITGTSVGSLNGAMFVLDQYETARDMWLAIRSKDVMELPEEDADLSALHQFLRSVVKAGGMDVTPLEEIVERVLDEDALRAAPIRFGLVTVEQRGLKPRELTLDEIPAGKVKDYPVLSHSRAKLFEALKANFSVLEHIGSYNYMGSSMADILSRIVHIHSAAYLQPHWVLFQRRKSLPAVSLVIFRACGI